ncbi:hypothetical protein [Chryseobacterium sp. RU33C]|uniref:hypothetical protein n=1 Tax=Chryseobacterium sp. RU33C TaxID=1907398 RepID=UPI0011158191|nr:hypothetical protein [Chryseobacterium sp. RU33C]
MNSDAVGISTNSSAFIDASSNTSINGNPNLGKGLIFPRTDLSTFTTFGGAPFGIPNNYPTFYDGMIVYNTKDGGVAGVGATQGELKPGFWYYDNKSKSVNGGTWKQISSPTTNTLSYTGDILTSIVNGVTSSVTISNTGVDNPANNGLSKDGNTIQLGGPLMKQTIISTDVGKELFIRGDGTNVINFDDNTFSVDALNNRIGIGTNTPTQRLDVAGKVKITDGTQGSGKVLTSDAAGVASWGDLPAATTVASNNGLSKNDTTIQLGGPLTKQTVIDVSVGKELFIRGDGTNVINFDENTLSVDALNNRIGIGTNTPAQKLDVAGAAIISDKLSVGSTLQGAALAVDNKNASEPIVAFSGTGSQRRVTVLDDGNMGIGNIVPTQKLDVDGNVRLRGVTNTTTLLPTDKIMVLNANGEAKKIDVTEFQQSVSKMYYKYYLITKSDGDDWVSNFDTKIPHSKYSVLVTGFDTNLKAPGAGFNFLSGSSAQFQIPNITPFKEGATWRLNIDVPNARPNVGSMIWGVKLLIISKDQITDLGSETFNLGSSITGGDNASPVP